MFEESLNKAVIRQLWDLPIVQQWSERFGHPLSYFGLPGSSIGTFSTGGLILVTALAWSGFATIRNNEKKI